MSAVIPTGTIITYQSDDWYSGWFSSASDVTSAVGAALLANDGITLRSIDSVSVSGVVQNIDKYLGGPSKFSVTLRVQVTGGTGFSSADDVASIINHEVYQATGKLPNSYTIPKIETPGTASVGGFLDWIKSLFTGMQSTGQPSASNSNFNLSSITGSGTLWIGLVIFGFVGALALIGYSGALRRD